MKGFTSGLFATLLLLVVLSGCNRCKNTKTENEHGNVRVHELTYQTPGVDGTMVTASGLLMIPPEGNGPFPLISCQHGTIFNRNVAPTCLESCAEAQAWMVEVAAKGYVVVMADYIGLGKAGVTPHPYFHSITEATSARDMIRAARVFCDSTGIVLNNKLFLVGYSQGGHVTAALQRLLEKEHADEFKITASAIMAAPFDLTMLWDHHVTSPNQISSAVTSLMFKTYFDIYKFGISYSDFLQKPYDSLVPVLLDYTHPEDVVIRELKDPPVKIFKAQFLTEVKKGTHPFATCLQVNEVYNWSPKSPTMLIFSRGDEVVPFAIENKAFARWKELGGNVDSTVLGQNFNHSDGFLPALQTAKAWFDGFDKK